MIRPTPLAGVALFAVLFGALPLFLQSDSDRPDLVATAPSRYQLNAVAPQALSASTEGAVIEPADGDGGPGLHLTFARKNYGDAYRREVAWPSLVGPFRDEADFVCGYDMYLGAKLFDTTGAGAGLQGAMRDSLAATFPSTPTIEGITVSLPALEQVELRVTPRSGYVELGLHVVLVDTTQLDVALSAWLIQENGAPALRRIPSAPVVARLEGPTKDRIIRQAREYGGGGGALLAGAGGCLFGPLGCLLGALFGGVMGGDAGEKKAVEGIQTTITAKIDEELERLTIGLEGFTRPFELVPSRPGDKTCVWLERHPIVTESGIRLPLCVQMKVAPPRVDAAIPGPISLGAERLTHDDTGSSDPIVALSLNADAIHQVVHYLWQSGQFREMGGSDAVVEALAKNLHIAAFDVTGLDPELPPTLARQQSANDALTFDFANLAIGTLDQRTVLAHGTTHFAVAQQNDTIALQSVMDDVHVNCVQSIEAGVRLTPCLSDLVPMVRRLARDGSEPKTLLRSSSSDLLARLPSLGLGGMRIRLSELQIRTHAKPAELELRVTAETQFKRQATRSVSATPGPSLRDCFGVDARSLASCRLAVAKRRQTTSPSKISARERAWD